MTLISLCVCVSHSVMSSSLWPRGLYSLPDSSVHGIEYWSRLPFLFPGDPPNPGIKPGSLAFQADSLPSEPMGKPLHILHSFFIWKGLWDATLTVPEVLVKGHNLNNYHTLSLTIFGSKLFIDLKISERPAMRSDFIFQTWQTLAHLYIYSSAYLSPLTFYHQH